MSTNAETGDLGHGEGLIAASRWAKAPTRESICESKDQDLQNASVGRPRRFRSEPARVRDGGSPPVSCSRSTRAFAATAGRDSTAWTAPDDSPFANAFAALWATRRQPGCRHGVAPLKSPPMRRPDPGGTRVMSS